MHKLLSSLRNSNSLTSILMRLATLVADALGITIQFISVIFSNLARIVMKTSDGENKERSDEDVERARRGTENV